MERFSVESCTRPHACNNMAIMHMLNCPIKGLYEPYQLLLSAFMSNGIVMAATLKLRPSHSSKAQR